MLAVALIAVWFAVVAVYLVRQWWVSELAQVRVGVPASASAALPAAPESTPERRAPTPTWSNRYAAAAAAR